MIFESQHFKVYLHHSANDGFSDGLGSYPKRLMSIGFAKSCAEQLADPLKVFADRAAWMVLIAKSVHGQKTSSALDEVPLVQPCSHTQLRTEIILRPSSM